MRKRVALAATEKEDYLPEISFGAEVVPDGQRPVNEYLDMRQAPLFDWGSNDVGENGVSEIRNNVDNILRSESMKRSD
jgi:hypothetical protein